jgi:hypothetical protein
VYIRFVILTTAEQENTKILRYCVEDAFILPTSAIGKLALNTTFKGSMRAAIVAGCVQARSRFYV